MVSTNKSRLTALFIWNTGPRLASFTERDRDSLFPAAHLFLSSGLQRALFILVHDFFHLPRPREDGVFVGMIGPPYLSKIPAKIPDPKRIGRQAHSSLRANVL